MFVFYELNTVRLSQCHIMMVSTIAANAVTIWGIMFTWASGLSS